MKAELPRQEVECDTCQIYTGKESDNVRICSTKGSCPGLEDDYYLRMAMIYNKAIRKIAFKIGTTDYHRGPLVRQLVNTILKGKPYTGRYIYEKEKLCFLQSGNIWHDDILLSDVTYVEKIAI